MQIRLEKIQFVEDIVNIEAETIREPDPESDDMVLTYHRSFRFTTTMGELIEISCSAEEKNALQIQEVDLCF
jgi:hypothetical protein